MRPRRIKSAAELVAYCQSQSGQDQLRQLVRTFQLVTELFKQKTGAPSSHSLQERTESVMAVISGQVTTTIADAGPVLSQVQAARCARWRLLRRSGCLNCPMCRP